MSNDTWHDGQFCSLYIYFSNSQLISVINNNNNVLIYEWPAMMSTYMDEMEPISMWWVEGILMASIMASNYTMFEFTLAVFSL